MSLHEWAETSGVLPTYPTTETGAVSVVLDHSHPDRAALWRLSDYAVSTVSGPVIWLVPRQK